MTDFREGRAWIELDWDALRHNVRLLRALLPAGCRLMPAIKANAYGHGAVAIARELNALGVDAFCVASILEGVELREHGISGEILILGYTHPQNVPLLGRYGLAQTVLDYTYARELDRCGQDIQVHIKIDTGMHRLGERFEHRDELQQIFGCGHLHITGAFTHLYGDDLSRPADRAAALKQGKAFYQTVERLKKRGCLIPKVHLLASGGLLHCPELGGDYARVGIALYGPPGGRSKTEKSLRPVLSLKARIALLKDLYQGEGAGYGHQFRAGRDTRIAVVSIGYADGLLRGLSNGVGAALVRGHVAPIAGCICMDQTLLDVTDIPEAAPGEIAVFIGKSGNKEITARDIAEQTGTIPNEILSRLGGRLERKQQPAQSLG